MGRFGLAFSLLFVFLNPMVSAWAVEDATREKRDPGYWRIELCAVPDILEHGPDREGDYFYMGWGEYEFRAFRHSTLALRFSPLFYYHEEEDADGGEGPIYGAALGGAYRLYWDAETLSGPYLHLGISALKHTSEFESNSTHLNFISEGGIGYQFRESPWSLSLKYTHISNAAIGSQNQGIDGIMFSLGFRF